MEVLWTFVSGSGDGCTGHMSVNEGIQCECEKFVLV